MFRIEEGVLLGIRIGNTPRKSSQATHNGAGEPISNVYCRSEERVVAENPGRDQNVHIQIFNCENLTDLDYRWPVTAILDDTRETLLWHSGT